MIVPERSQSIELPKILDAGTYFNRLIEFGKYSDVKAIAVTTYAGRYDCVCEAARHFGIHGIVMRFPGPEESGISPAVCAAEKVLHARDIFHADGHFERKNNAHELKIIVAADCMNRIPGKMLYIGKALTMDDHLAHIDDWHRAAHTGTGIISETSYAALAIAGDRQQLFLRNDVVNIIPRTRSDIHDLFHHPMDTFELFQDVAHSFSTEWAVDTNIAVVIDENKRELTGKEAVERARGASIVHMKALIQDVLLSFAR